jgi:hypothetical protein
MAEAKTRPKAQEIPEAEGVSHPPSAPPLTSLERLADLTRRIIAVPKSEAIPRNRRRNESAASFAVRKWSTSGRVKIERAYEHIAEFERELAAFRDTRPYRVIRESDSDDHPSGMLVAIQADPMPIRFSTITADCIHNLHVALDHLWQRATLGPGSSKRNYFPAYPSAETASQI